MEDATDQNEDEPLLISAGSHQYPVINTVEQTLEAAIGENASESDRRELLTAFEDDCLRMKQMLGDSLTAQDREALGRAIHYVRGTLNTLSASSLTKMVASLADPADRGDWKEVGVRYAHFHTALDNLLLDLQDWARGQ